MAMGFSKKQIKRLLDKIKVETRDGCHLWQGAVAGGGGGYGYIYVNYKNYYAHRAMYELARGPIPEGLCVCHSCDNPRCVNPKHLFIGTQADNIRDASSKGRLRRSPETKAKMAAGKMGKKQPEHSIRMKEHYADPKARAKQSAAMSRPDVRAKLSATFQSPEVKANRSAAQKLRWERYRQQKEAQS